MDRRQHLLQAVRWGLATGAAVGLVDMTSRIVQWQFEAFELYQTVLIHMVGVAAVFAVFALVLEAIMAVSRRLSGTTLRRLYLANALGGMTVLYGAVLVRYRLLGSSLAPDLSLVQYGLFIAGGAAAVYAAVAADWRGVGDRLLSRLSSSAPAAHLDDILLFLGVFALTALAVDAYAYDAQIPHLENERSDAPPDAPNVILVSLDTTRADHLSVYGYERNTTPTLSRVDDDGVVFEQAVAPSPWTLPTHASMFTGRYPHRHGAMHGRNYLVQESRTLAEVLRDEGYVTGGTVAGAFVKRLHGVDQGFQMYRDRLDFFEQEHHNTQLSLRNLFEYAFPHVEEAVFRSDIERPAEAVTDDAVAFIENHKSERFFLFAHYFDPHEPYDRGSRYAPRPTLAERKQMSEAFHSHTLPDDQLLPYMENRYDSEIYSMDRQLDRLFTRLDELGLRNETIVIVTADHGEQFYEHGGFGHRPWLYQEVLHVPLIVRYPPETAVRRVARPVSITHVAPTVLNLTGIAPPPAMEGPVLPATAQGATTYGPDYVFAERSSRTAVINGSWKLTRYPERNRTRLFDLAADPGEEDDISADQPALVHRLKSVISAFRSS